MTSYAYVTNHISIICQLRYLSHTHMYTFYTTNYYQYNIIELFTSMSNTKMFTFKRSITWCLELANLFQYCHLDLQFYIFYRFHLIKTLARSNFPHYYVDIHLPRLQSYNTLMNIKEGFFATFFVTFLYKENVERA